MVDNGTTYYPEEPFILNQIKNIAITLAWFDDGLINLIFHTGSGNDSTRSRSYDFWIYNYMQRQRCSRIERFFK
jgi:hypothetical protein